MARDQLEAPFDLVYETPNLRTIQLIQAGRNVYDPAVWADRPFWFTVYTPLYHHLVALLPPCGRNPFLPGRITAMVCMVLAAATVFLVPGRRASLALLALGCFFLVRPVVSNTAFLKNDSLGVLCSGLAIVAVARFRRGAAWTLAAAVLGVLAVASKQSFVAALAAGLGFLLLADRRHAALFAAAGPGLLIGLGLLARVAWGPGLWFCLFGALGNNTLRWDGFVSQGQAMLVQPVVVVVVGAALVTAVTAGARARSAVVRESPFPLYVVVSLAVLLATMGQALASTNYLIEPMLAGLLWLVFASGSRGGTEVRGRPVWVCVVLVSAAAAGEIAFVPSADVSFTTRAATPETARAFEQLAAEIRARADTRAGILNLYGARFAPPELDGDVYVNDPTLYVMLWQSGALDTSALERGLRGRAFGGVLAPAGLLTAADPGPYGRYRQTLAQSYRVGRSFGPFDLLIPIAGP